MPSLKNIISESAVFEAPFNFFHSWKVLFFEILKFLYFKLFHQFQNLQHDEEHMVEYIIIDLLNCKSLGQDT